MNDQGNARIAREFLAMAAAGSVGVAVLVGGSFVLTAMFLTSTWFSFRDCFQAD